MLAPVYVEPDDMARIVGSFSNGVQACNGTRHAGVGAGTEYRSAAVGLGALGGQCGSTAVVGVSYAEPTCSMYHLNDS
jgi:hypothetical protein